MNILLIGSGGREHALAWSLADSPLTSRLVIAPGNPGMEAFGEMFPIAVDDLDGLCTLAGDITADLVVIGPEAPLVAGLADRLARLDIAVFGPSAAAAMLEGSKAFARAFCARHNVPQPAFYPVSDYKSACKFIDQLGGYCVIKADGLAAGKGVVVADDAATAKVAAKSMLSGQFGSAGKRLIIEQRISGPEASLFALLDGENAILMATAQDHKRANDNDQGPNTGGMGAISPSPRLDKALEDQVMAEIVDPVVRGMAAENTPYHGVLYVGLMLTEKGPQVIEFNCRFGDPEAQAILPRLKTDIVSAMMATTTASLHHFDMRWDQRSAVTVVMANKGYPGNYEKGDVIRNLEVAEQTYDCHVFHAGTARDNNGDLIAVGGRVLTVTALGDDTASARKDAYEVVTKIAWNTCFYRSDIGNV
jgi:phosphoribosylamine--glycine ligase